MADELSDDEIAKVANVFAPWFTGSTYPLGAVVQYDGIAYRCLQLHTANDPTHTPDLVPALWHPYTPAGQVAEWVQPYGGSGTYVEGTVVTHNGATWVNVHAAPALNVWEPGVYGWTKQ